MKKMKNKMNNGRKKKRNTILLNEIIKNKVTINYKTKF